MAVQADVTHLVAALAIAACVSGHFHQWRLLAHLRTLDEADLEKFEWKPRVFSSRWFGVKWSSNLFLPSSILLRLIFAGLPNSGNHPPRVEKLAARMRWSYIVFFLLFPVLFLVVMGREQA